MARSAAGSAQLGEALDRPVPAQPRQAFDPEDAVELVDLVLEAGRPEALGLFLSLGAVEVSRADYHRLLDRALELPDAWAG